MTRAGRSLKASVTPALGNDEVGCLARMGYGVAWRVRGEREVTSCPNIGIQYLDRRPGWPLVEIGMRESRMNVYSSRTTIRQSNSNDDYM